MIKLKTLSLSNFICIEKAEFDFSNNYITVFYGPNGSGKSAIFEALALCWTERKRGSTYKDFIRHGTTSASVKLSATLQDEPILFDIEISEKDGFQRTITYKEVTYKNSECTTLLASLDIEYLQHIMFSMQGEDNITDLKPSERTKLLKRIFNFEFTSEISQLNAQIDQENQNIITLKAQQDIYSRNTYTYENESPLLTETEILQIETRIKEIEDQIRILDRRNMLQEEAATRLRDLKSSQDSLLSRKASLESSISSSTASLAKLQDDKGKHAKALSNLAPTESLQHQIEEAEQLITTLTERVTTNKKILEDTQNTIYTWKSKTLELINHITAHKQGECSHCGQKTEPTLVPELEAQLSSINTQISEASIQKAQLEVETGLVEKDLFQTQASIPALQNQIKQNSSLKTQYQSILKTTEESITQTQSDLIGYQKAINEITDQINSTVAQIKELSSQVSDTQSSKGLVEEKNRLLEKIQNNKSTKAQNEIIRRKNGETQQKEAENKKALEASLQQQNTALINIGVYKDSKHVFETLLPNYIIIRACSKLEKCINDFISKVKPGMIVKLFQTRFGVEFCYSPTSNNKDVDNWTSTKMASGFEKELLSVAWRIALAQSYHLFALMLDEIDSAGSTDSSERMFREIANLDGFDQLFIISHKPEVINIIKLENERVTGYFVSEGTFTYQEY